MGTSHRLLEVLYFATVSLVLLKSVLPLIVMEAFGARRPADDFR
jgi:hypothetical protein